MATTEQFHALFDPRGVVVAGASTRSMGTRRMATSARASAKMPPMPSITVMPKVGSRCTPAISSREPRAIGAISTFTSPSAGVADASSSSAARSTSSVFCRPSRTNPRSVLCAIASPHSLATTGQPYGMAASAAARGESTSCWGCMGTP